MQVVNQKLLETLQPEQVEVEIHLEVLSKGSEGYGAYPVNVIAYFVAPTADLLKAKLASADT